MSFFELEATTLSGQQQSFSEFEGKVVLVVNVASACGLTPQYEGLESLYSQLSDKGLVVVGFPCNQFGAQEPGSAEEIAQFCEVNFGVSFPLMSKIEVNGAGQHPVYTWLKTQSGDESDIGWNFRQVSCGSGRKDCQTLRT